MTPSEESLYLERTRQLRRAGATIKTALFWNLIGWLLAAAAWMVHLEPVQIAMPDLYTITRDPRATLTVVLVSLISFAAAVHLFAKERGQ